MLLDQVAGHAPFGDRRSRPRAPYGIWKFDGTLLNEVRKCLIEHVFVDLLS